MSETFSTLSPLTIPRQAVLDGGIEYPGNVVVEGTILGDVRCSSVVISERGVVEGTICADSATILGEASGSIYANHVTLKTACSVTAEIFYKKLSLENGCYFEGKSRRVASPLSLTDWEAAERYTSDGLVR
jgi:cytoskeletal protein CcmA (bactofilin family)